MKTVTTLFSTALTAALVIGNLTGQASVSTFGTACTLQAGGSAGTPAIGHTGTPRIGQTFSLTYTGPNYQFSSAQQTAQPMLALGTQLIAATLPLFNLIYQPSNCTAYVTPISLTPMAGSATQPEYESSYAITIPNAPSLIGFQFVGQWLLVHSQCGFTGCGLSALVTSDAALVTVGT